MRRNFRKPLDVELSRFTSGVGVFKGPSGSAADNARPFACPARGRGANTVDVRGAIQQHVVRTGARSIPALHSKCGALASGTWPI